MKHFEKEIPKTLSYTMVDKFDDYFEQLVKEMQHIETDRQLDEHMQLIILSLSAASASYTASFSRYFSYHLP